MAWNVYPASEQVKTWIGALSDNQQETLVAAIEILEERGPDLGRPIVDQVKGSKFQKMKELRPPNVEGAVLRVLFAFTSRREAALLVGGDKAEGSQWNRWYGRWIPVADKLLTEIERELTSMKQAPRKKPRR